MKNIFIGCLLFILPFNLFAQSNIVEKKKFVLNVGVENHFPIQEFKSFYNYGIGTSINAGYNFSDKFSVTFNPSYLKYLFNYKKTGIKGNTDYFSLMGGIKYVLPFNIFIFGQSGISIKMQETPSEKAFAYAAGAGTQHKKFTIELKYLNVRGITTSPQIIGIRIGYDLN